MRHARVTVVQIGVTHRSGFLMVRILDNGKGISKQRLDHSSGFGLSSMRERTKELGGSIDYGSAQGWGFEVVIQIPFTRV